MKARSIGIATVALSVVLLLCSFSTVSSTFTIHASNGEREDWFDPRWHYRLFLQVNATDYVRRDYPVDLLVDFTGYIGSGETIDSNSIRVLENGTVEVPSQYDPLNNTAGNVIFVVNGTTDPLEARNYTVYFDTEENGLKPVPDYGDPDYVLQYQEIFEGLGSSPFNGSTDKWWFPSYLGYGGVDGHTEVIGEVKAVSTRWVDVWDGAKWIRQTSTAVAYRDSFNVYVTVSNNDTSSEAGWASGLLNISTGSPSGTGFGSLDNGLVVITDDWTVDDWNNRFDWLTNASGNIYIMADDTLDIYDSGNPENESVTYGYTTGPPYPVIDGIVGSGNEVIEILEVQRADDTPIAPTAYSLNTTVSPRTIVYDWTSETEFADGENVEIIFRRKLYGTNQLLRVVPKETTTQYLIMYDTDEPDGTPYAKPQIGSLLFPQLIEASDMVVEFWMNVTDSSHGDYYLNISTNFDEWWYNTSLTPAQNNDPQENEFEFVMNYMNGSADPEQEVNDLLVSIENTADIEIIGQEDAIPIGLDVLTPLHGQSFNAWIALPGIPRDDEMVINASVTGETVGRIYYKLGADGAEVDFSGEESFNLPDDLDGDFLDGRIDIQVVVEDTNGTMVSEITTVFIVKSWWQSLFSAAGTIFIVISSVFGGFLALFGLASIKKQRSLKKSGI